MAEAKKAATGHESSAHDVKDADARGYRKVRRGYVTSDKMDKTIVVEVEDRVKHPLYGKVIRPTSKVKAHDELNAAGIGDSVQNVRSRGNSSSSSSMRLSRRSRERIV